MTKKQAEALRTACEALQYCLDNDIDQDKSRDAMDIIAEMLVKYQHSSTRSSAPSKRRNKGD